MIDRFLGDAFWGFVQPVLKYCSSVWCAVADTHLKQLDRVAIVVPVFELGVCLSVTLRIVDLWQYCIGCIRSVITCKQMHPLYGALPVPYVPVYVTRGILAASSLPPHSVS